MQEETKVSLAFDDSDTHQQEQTHVQAHANEGGMEKYVYALYDYQGDAGKLSFRQGDVIRVIEETGTGWDSGELDGNMGWYPSTYVELHAFERRASGLVTQEQQVEEPYCANGDSKDAASIPANNADADAAVEETKAVTAAESVDEDIVIVHYYDRKAMVDWFWETDAKGVPGWSTVLAHMNSGLRALTEAFNIISLRAKLDHERACGLKELANMQQQSLLRGTLEQPLAEITVKATLAEAEIYTKSSASMAHNSDISKKLQSFSGELKIIINKFTQKAEQCRLDCARYETQSEVAKTAYFAICADIQAKGKLGDQKARRKIEAARSEYSELVKMRNSSLQNRLDAMVEAFELFELKDAERIALLREVFGSYINVGNTKSKEMAGLYLSVPPLLETIDAVKDNMTFVETNATGQRRPKPLIEEEYDPRAFQPEDTKKYKTLHRTVRRKK